jgi:hypothetical protein
MATSLGVMRVMTCSLRSLAIVLEYHLGFSVPAVAEASARLGRQTEYCASVKTAFRGYRICRASPQPLLSLVALPVGAESLQPLGHRRELEARSAA